MQSYPILYYLYAKAPETFLLADVSNNSLGSVLGSKAVNDGIGYPGKVFRLQIISRTLENRDGVEILK
jgi:hypothetical protein